MVVAGAASAGGATVVVTATSLRRASLSSSRSASATGIIRTPTSPTAPMRSSRGSTPTAARYAGSVSSQWSTGAQSSVASVCGAAGRDVTTWWVRVRSNEWARVRGIAPVTSRASWPRRLTRVTLPVSSERIAGRSVLTGSLARELARLDAPGRFHSGSSQSCVSSSRESVINVPRPPNRAVGRAQVYTSRHATATSGQRIRHDGGVSGEGGI